MVSRTTEGRKWLQYAIMLRIGPTRPFQGALHCSKQMPQCRAVAIFTRMQQAAYKHTSPIANLVQDFFFFSASPLAALGAAYKTQTLLVAWLPAQTIKHGNRLCYTAECFRRKQEGIPVQLFNSSSLPPKFPSQQIGTSHFSAVSSNSTTQHPVEQWCCCLLTIGHKFRAYFPPPPLQGHIRKLSPKLKAPGRTIDLQQCSAFSYYSAALTTFLLNLTRGQAPSGRSQWFELALTVHSSRFWSLCCMTYRENS